MVAPLVFLFVLLGASRASLSTVYHVHLALTGDPSQMAASWYTDGNTSSSIVQYGSSANSLNMNVSGISVSYATSGVMHHAVMTGLTPSQTYFYRVGDGSTWSSVFKFSAAPSENRPFKIIVYGDEGITESMDTRADVQQIVQKGEVDWVYHIGDISYADDWSAWLPELYEEVWNIWFSSIQPVSSIVPYMVCPGNHEYHCQSAACEEWTANFTAYRHRFRMPSEESGGQQNMFYSFDYSYVHFVAISTETDFPNSPFPPTFGDQIAWLEQDLQEANANRAERPWIIVVGHRPIYSIADDYSEGGIPVGASYDLQQAFEALFLKYGVDLFLVGHVHGYERQFPIYNNAITSYSYTNPPSTVHIVSGAAGNTEKLDDAPSFIPKWNAFQNFVDYGYGMLEINSTTLFWQQFASWDNHLIDKVSIIKNKP